MKSFKGLLICSTVFSMAAVHGLEIKADSKEDAVIQFIEEVAAKLPDSVKKDIPGTIKLSFKKFNDEDSIEPDRVCSTKQKTAQRYGSAYINKGKIELHAGFLKPIRNYQAGKSVAKLNCPQKDLYTLAQGALIHELAHFYDFKTHDRKSDRVVRQIPRGNPNPYQSYEDVHKNNFSSIPTYAFINGWRFVSPKSRSPKMKHRKVSYSPDFYEYQDLKENFAVNFQFFLLDEDYQCRRPAQYEFMSKELAHRPFAYKKCEEEVTVPLLVDNKLRLEKINPSHIRDVHYLYAGESDAMMSRWGHSMFRFTVCPPEVKDRRCLLDPRYNFVLNFTGFIPGLEINNYDGLVGNYDSVISITKLSPTLKQYTKGENREVFSYPLNITKEQKRRFINLAMQRVWGYMGSYKFLTNNCATESLDFLKAIVWDSKVQNSNAKTPVGMREVLDEIGLIDMFEEQEYKEKRKKHQYFPSAMEKVEKSLERYTSAFNELKDVGELSTEQRLVLAEQIKDPQLAANMVIVEANTFDYLSQSLLTKKLNFLKEQKSSEPLVKTMLDFLKVDHISSIERDRS
ncbi:MAG: DUF4105 domain-containing protein, partial [Bacteriovoracaceae bacterium]|nr:DUF4105 domain-containing protein [Bacteriovoracaceae bacterium]